MEDCERGKPDPTRPDLDLGRFSGVGGIQLVESPVSMFDPTSIFDCVRLSLPASGFARSGFEGDFFSGGAPTGLNRVGSARKADAWSAIESIFLN